MYMNKYYEKIDYQLLNKHIGHHLELLNIISK